MAEEKSPTDWYPVYSTTENHRAHIAKALLEEEDIPAVILDKQDSSYVNFNQLSPIHLLVQSQDVIRAKHLLEKAEL
jgi:hypothetical protein